MFRRNRDLLYSRRKECRWLSICGKIPLLHGWFLKRPVIEGSWKVEIRSNWKDPATGNAIAPVEGYMVVRQTFSTLSLRLLTAESSSELVGTEIVCSADGLLRSRRLSQ